ncbi:MAG: LacI family transcriptional regulator [Maribacter sp.]
MRRKITLKHIARELEVSISTVSKALKNSSEISRDTTDKIQAFAKRYNYKPNNIAVSLKNKRTKNIGVIIPDIVHHFFTTVFRGIEHYANQHGYNVIVCISDESFDREVINMEMLVNGSIDGVIMALAGETQLKKDFNHLKEVTEQGIPLVLFDRVSDEIRCDKVVLNDAEIAYEATISLITEGRRRIALLTTDNFFSVSNSRELGYRKALEENCISIDEQLILRLPYNEDVAGIEFFLVENNIDGILSVNEIFAIHGIGVLKKMGFKIPENISVIGFTDGILSKYSEPKLTTVAQHGNKMGEVAAKLLIEKIENDVDEEDEVFTTEVIAATIIRRESTINENF